MITEQDVARRVLVTIPLYCPKCHEAYCTDSITLFNTTIGTGWHLTVRCGNCNRPDSKCLGLEAEEVKNAKERVTLGRSIAETARLWGLPKIPINFVKCLPEVLGNLWEPNSQGDTQFSKIAS